MSVFFQTSSFLLRPFWTTFNSLDLERLRWVKMPFNPSFEWSLVWAFSLWGISKSWVISQTPTLRRAAIYVYCYILCICTFLTTVFISLIDILSQTLTNNVYDTQIFLPRNGFLFLWGIPVSSQKNPLRLVLECYCTCNGGWGLWSQPKTCTDVVNYWNSVSAFLRNTKRHREQHYQKKSSYALYWKPISPAL